LICANTVRVARPLIVGKRSRTPSVEASCLQISKNYARPPEVSLQKAVCFRLWQEGARIMMTLRCAPDVDVSFLLALDVAALRARMVGGSRGETIP
jgi:hypothetical protein